MSRVTKTTAYTGAALALALEHSGLDILIVDGSPLSVSPFAAQAPFEPRVSALSMASQRILERLQKQDWRVRTLVSPRSWSPFTCRTPRTSQIPRATWRFWCLRCVRCSCSSFHMSMSSANSICSMKSSSRS